MSCVPNIGGYRGDPGGPKLRRVGPKWTKSKERRLMDMVASDDPRRRATAAGSPHLSKRLMLDLLKDEDVNVRRAVVKNPAMPDEVMELALRDEDSGIRIYAKMILGIEEEYV